MDSLLNRGGMASMLNTVWLIVCAMAFGACMERAGLLERLVEQILRAVRGPGSLVVATILTAIGVNVIASDQYIAIVLPGRLFKLEFDRQGLEPVNLSRAIEDGGTMTSALVPWNTCGAYMAATLGVATLDYLPYALLNWLSPLIAMAMAIAGFKLLRRPVPAAR
jgi:NhaC family Na+:H+ antiporter